MHVSTRVSACVLFLACSASVFAQQATSWVSAEWTPVTEENARLFQQADTAFKTAVDTDYQQRVAEAKSVHPSRSGDGSGSSVSASDQNQPIPGGMKGPGEPRGHGRVPEAPTVTSLEKLLPSALDFAAPTSGGLIVQKMSGSVLFGRTDSDAMVMLPLSGETDLPHGMRGEIREEGDQLRLKVQLATGQVVEYRYQADPEASGRAMTVEISILGALPGKSVEFRRVYRRAQVNVGELKKPA